MSDSESKSPFRVFLDILENLLLGGMTDRALASAGAESNSLKATLKVGLPTGYDRASEEAAQRNAAVFFMRSQLGKGYRLGAEVKPGQEAAATEWDCSEETEAAARVAQWQPRLPDGAQAQYDFCRPIDFPQAGDLGFLWSEVRGCIGHVMMATGQGTVIHAVGGRGVVEDPVHRWENHPRWRGWRQAPGFAREGLS